MHSCRRALNWNCQYSNNTTHPCCGDFDTHTDCYALVAVCFSLRWTDSDSNNSRQFACESGYYCAVSTHREHRASITTIIIDESAPIAIDCEYRHRFLDSSLACFCFCFIFLLLISLLPWSCERATTARHRIWCVCVCRTRSMKTTEPQVLNYKYTNIIIQKQFSCFTFSRCPIMVGCFATLRRKYYYTYDYVCLC